MTAQQRSKPQGDKLLWILGTGVAAVAIVFFAFLNMDAPEFAATQSSDSPDLSEAPDAAADPGTPGAPEDFTVRLNRARLAADAGMLSEPEGYSAWSIYAAILEQDATNADAIEGLRKVADRLVDQAFDALNAGRRDAAEGFAAGVLRRFPDHRDANEILTRVRRTIVAENPGPDAAPELPATPAVATTRSRQDRAPEAVAEPKAADPIAEIYSNFTRALANGALRKPAQDNAAEYVNALRVQNAEHAMTREAEQQLFEAMFLRHTLAFNELDSDAALDWLDAANELQIDADRVISARNQILDFLAAQAATESVNTAQLSIRSYVPPQYPTTALRRGLEGWVDVAFVLSLEGRPRSVEVTEASNSIFRRAATRAVEKWEFEPYTVHERVVEQHAHTRIRFVIED